MAFETQPDMLPTNKLAVASLVGPAVYEVWGTVMLTIFPALAGPAMGMLVAAAATLLVGYFVPDRAGISGA